VIGMLAATSAGIIDGSVMSGKFIGEKNTKAASAIFSKTGLRRPDRIGPDRGVQPVVARRGRDAAGRGCAYPSPLLALLLVSRYRPSRVVAGA
jgi:hypothetical protein